MVGLLVPAFATSSAHAAAAPAGMFNIGGWAWPTDSELARESGQGLRSWRIPVDYGTVGSVQGSYNFSGYDGLVGRMAAKNMTPLFVLTGCPAWACPNGGPANSATALPGWKAFVSAAVKRYGTGGTYWSTHPTVPARPVTTWQLLNEVNGSAQWPNPNPTAYANFVIATAPSIRAADPAAKIVLSGLPEKMTIWMKDYLPALYAVPGFKAAFDVVAIHGYAPTPADVPKILDTARSIMVANGDAAKPIWITEMSWSTGGPAHPFTTTEAGQAANLTASWSTMVGCQSRWNLQRVYWYGDIDKSPGTAPDYWGYHTGLLRTDWSSKPALAQMDRFTSGATLTEPAANGCSLPGGTSIDSSVPDTSITSGPGARTASTTPSFTFASTESGVHYECHIEGSPWATCTPNASGSWTPATALGQGSHTLSVRAVDASGNADATPASSSFIVDLSPPDTYISGVWGNVTTAANTLTLSSNEPVLRYECRVDTAAWATCTSPFTATLTAGAHTISVRAIDLAGHPDVAPATPWYQVRLP